MTDNEMQMVFLEMLDDCGEEITREQLYDEVERIIDNLRYAITDIADDYEIEDYYMPI